MLAALLLLVAVGGGVVTHKRCFAERDLRSLLTSSACLLPALALVVVAWLSPRTFRAWMQEDGPAEWGTVLAFSVAAALYARGALVVERPWLTRAAFVSVALFCFVVAGEELSWGQRLFALEPPALFLEHNFQQELNVHNLLTNRDALGLRLDTRFFVAGLAVFYGGVFPLARSWLSRSSSAVLLAAGAVSPAAVLSVGFLVVAAVELAYPVSLTGEAAELVFGLCFVAAGALLSPKGRALAVPAIVASVLLLGSVTPAVIDRMIYGSDEERVALAQQELLLLARDLKKPGVLSQRRLERKKSVHKRVFTATKAGYLRFGDESAYLEQARTPAESDDDGARRDRRGWFLDPWNNPYWLAWSSEHERVSLYSFGPDRKRNGRYSKSPETEGDDVTVHLKAPWSDR